MTAVADLAVAAALALPTERGTMTDDARSRLAAAVQQRRKELRLPADLARFGGPARMTLQRIEKGTSGIAPRTWSKLETALKWAPGTVDRIIDGAHVDELAVDHEPPHPLAVAVNFDPFDLHAENLRLRALCATWEAAALAGLLALGLDADTTTRVRARIRELVSPDVAARTTERQK